MQFPPAHNCALHRVSGFIFIKAALVFAWLGLSLLYVADVAAAEYEFLEIETVFSKPPQASWVHAYAIVLSSSRQKFKGLSASERDILHDYFVYQTKIKIGGKIFYRLAMGDFQNISDARSALDRVKQNYADAWVYKRKKSERHKLASFLKTPQVVQTTVVQKNSTRKTSRDAPESLLSLARQEFIDQNYARVITIVDKIILSGDLDQVREALELAGIARERQGKYSQAVVLYKALLDTRPPPNMVTRIDSRLEGIRSINATPKARLDKPSDEKDPIKWSVNGALFQYYRNDLIEVSNERSEIVNKALVTDVDFLAQRKSNDSVFAFQLDAGWQKDFLDDDDQTRISQANVSYIDTNRDFRIALGRQSRRIIGLYGRFDGITYEDISHSDYRFNYALGYLVQSSYDTFDDDNPFVAVNMEHSPNRWLDLDLYLIHQEIAGLIDRQAIGVEYYLHKDASFLFGVFDYDLFFEQVNNLSIVSSYQVTHQWTFNFNIDRRKSPLLSTKNALQGQLVESIDDLRSMFSDDEIYQLAEDRTSSSKSLLLGASYRIDASRQLYFDVNHFELDSTLTSGGVAGNPATSNTQISADYFFRGLFYSDDYSGIGIRMTDSSTRESTSIRLRTRFSGNGGIIYEPRILVSSRRSKDDDLEQLIVNPVIKLKYRSSRRLTFEGALGLEYSDFDLPDFDRQYAYSLYIGYYYYF